MLCARVLLAVCLPLACTACAASWQDVQHSAYYPDRLTVGVGGSYDRVNDRWDKIIPAFGVSWPLKPTPTAPIYPRPTPGTGPDTHIRGEGEAP